MSNSDRKWRPIVIKNASTRLRSEREMPDWVSRSGLREPPPPPIPVKGGATQPEPEYEVIDFNQQAYCNAPPLRPKADGNNKPHDGRHCDLCGCSNPSVKCDKCAQQVFCLSCDDMYHRHPKRQTHNRRAVVVSQAQPQYRPPLPPKGEQIVAPPVPPPRRNKRPGSVAGSPCPSPVPQRHEMIPPSLPRKESIGATSTLKSKMSNIKRMISNRPLPAVPQLSQFGGSKSEHGGSPPPSLLSKRSLGGGETPMSLQERYRLHQLAMTAADENRHSRRLSQGSWGARDNESPSVDSGYPDWELDQWQQLSPRQRSNSVSGMSDTAPGGGNFVASGFATTGHRRKLADMHGGVTARGTAPGAHNRLLHGTSMCNLDQLPPPQMHQAMSMAQLNTLHPNYPGGVWTDQWGNCYPMYPGLSGSNLSLNSPPVGMQPPPMWFPSPWPPGMYPGAGYPPPMGPGPPPPPDGGRSRAHSPTLSIRSRKSQASRYTSRSRNNKYHHYEDDNDADTEDRDDSDRMSRRSTGRYRDASPVSRKSRQRDASPRKTHQREASPISKKSSSRIRDQSPVTKKSSTHPRDNSPVMKKTSARLRDNSPVSRKSGDFRDVTPSDSSKRTSTSRFADDSDKRNTIIRRAKQETLKSSAVRKSPSDRNSSSDESYEAGSESLSDESEEEEEPVNKRSGDEEIIEKSSEKESDLNEEDLLSIKDDIVSINDVSTTEIYVPDHDWECEYCTFTNDAGVRICAVCCKTPTRKPVVKKPVETSKNKSSSSSTTKESTDSHKIVSSESVVSESDNDKKKTSEVKSGKKGGSNEAGKISKPLTSSSHIKTALKSGPVNELRNIRDSLKSSINRGIKMSGTNDESKLGRSFKSSSILKNKTENGVKESDVKKTVSTGMNTKGTLRKNTELTSKFNESVEAKAATTKTVVSSGTNTITRGLKSASKTDESKSTTKLGTSSIKTKSDPIKSISNSDTVNTVNTVKLARNDELKSNTNHDVSKLETNNVRNTVHNEFVGGLKSPLKSSDLGLAKGTTKLGYRSSLKSEANGESVGGLKNSGPNNVSVGSKLSYSKSSSKLETNGESVGVLKNSLKSSASNGSIGTKCSTKLGTGYGRSSAKLDTNGDAVGVLKNSLKSSASNDSIGTRNSDTSRTTLTSTDDSSESKKKGFRKISFWPGTKFTPKHNGDENFVPVLKSNI